MVTEEDKKRRKVKAVSSVDRWRWRRRAIAKVEVRKQQVLCTEKERKKRA